MRNVCSVAAAVAALSVLIPSGAFSQGLSITNYQLVTERKVTRTVSDFDYRADVVNTGVARPSVTATVASPAASVQVIQGSLHFVNVPANGKATSSDAFTIRVDRTIAFDFANLQWTFLAPTAPVANAGPNQTAPLGATVTLNGSGSSNPSGAGTLTYSWAFTSRPAGSAAALSNPTSVGPTFVIDVAGSYVIALTVSNGFATDSASVTVSTSNTAPVANAGPNQTVSVGATVHLNGSGSSDVDGDPLTYAWTLTSLPAGSTAILTGANTVSPTFVVDKFGTYVARLIVNDGKVNSGPATVTITTQNTPPVANAGPNQSVSLGALVQLNGSGSTDVDGDPLTYQWSLISVASGSAATLSSSLVNPTFTADRPGTYVAQLIVNDGKVNSAPAMVTITTNALQAPTANAGPNQTVLHGATVTLHGSGTDPQSLPLTFLWSLTTKPAGSSAVLSGTTVASPTFVADLPGTYVAQLIVNDGFLSSAPATVTITTTNTPPAANAGPNQTVAIGSTVTLNGSGSSDADGDPLTYLWSFTSRAAGSAATLAGSTTVSPTFVADVAGTYVVQLMVSDPFSGSSPVTVTITTAAPGQIVVPATTTVGLGQSATFPVTLGAPAPVAVTITLSSSDTTKVTLSAGTVVIPQGATQPSQQPQVTGVNLGSATISASGTGYTPASGTVQVTATVGFTPSTLTIIGTATQPLTLTLSATAPAGGVALNVSSDTPGVATVPGTVTIPQGATSVSVPVTGVAAGTAVIHASGTNIPDATAAVTVIAQLTITTASLPDGQIGVAYSQMLTATGGTTPLTWTLTAGTLPNGLVLNAATGLISGPPTTAVTGVHLTFKATDSGSPAQTASVNLTINIAPAKLTISTTSLANGQVGVGYSQTLAATGGTTPFTWTLTAGTLPAGLSLDAATGQISGPPTAAVAGAPVSFKVTDSGSPAQTATVSLTITIAPATLVITTNSLVPGQAGVPYSQLLGASGGTPPFTWTLTSGTLPANLNLVASPGQITGTPLAAASVPLTFRVTDSGAPAQAASVTLTLTVSATTNSPINITSISVGQNLQAPLIISIPGGAPSSFNLTITSADLTKLLIGLPDVGAPCGTGCPSISVPILAGQTAVAGIFAKAVAGAGTVQVTASAPGFLGSAPINLTPSGFVLVGPNGPGSPSFTVSQGVNTTQLTLTSYRLDSSLNPVEPQAVAKTLTRIDPVTLQVIDLGTTVQISDSSPAIGTVAPTSLTIFSGSSTGTTTFSAFATGSTTITAVTPASPAGFSTPAGGAASQQATVTASGLNPISPPVTVGRNLETTANITLNGAAPAGDLIVTVASNDPTKVLFSQTPTDPGLPVITLKVTAGNTHTPDFYVYGLDSTGSVGYTASAPAFGSIQGTIALAPSGFVMSGPFGLGADFFTVTKSANSDLSIIAAQLDASLNLVAVQAVRGGLSIDVSVTSSVTSVGAITVSPVTIAAGSASANTQFQPGGVGTTILAASAVSYSIPATGGSLNATVRDPKIVVADQIPIGKGLQSSGTLLLGQPAPTNGLVVTLTSNSPSLKLSLTATGAGSSSVVVTVPAGQSFASYFIQSSASSGTGTYTGTATGYASGTGTILFSPSGVIIAGPLGNHLPLVASVAGGKQPVSVSMARLNDTGGPAEVQSLAGGSSLSVSLTIDSSAIGTIASPVSVAGGSFTAIAQFTPVATGNTTIRVTTPAGFVEPNDLATLPVQVQ